MRHEPEGRERPRKRRGSRVGEINDWMDTIERGANMFEGFAGRVGRLRGRRAAEPDSGPLELTCFQIMGLKPNCTRDELSRQFRRLQGAYHPDSGATDDTMSKRISSAYQQALLAVEDRGG